MLQQKNPNFCMKEIRKTLLTGDHAPNLSPLKTPWLILRVNIKHFTTGNRDQYFILSSVPNHPGTFTSTSDSQVESRPRLQLDPRPTSRLWLVAAAEGEKQVCRPPDLHSHLLTLRCIYSLMTFLLLLLMLTRRRLSHNNRTVSVEMSR